MLISEIGPQLAEVNRLAIEFPFDDSGSQSVIEQFARLREALEQAQRLLMDGADS